MTMEQRLIISLSQSICFKEEYIYLLKNKKYSLPPQTSGKLESLKNFS